MKRLQNSLRGKAQALGNAIDGCESWYCSGVERASQSCSTMMVSAQACLVSCCTATAMECPLYRVILFSPESRFGVHARVAKGNCRQIAELCSQSHKLHV